MVELTIKRNPDNSADFELPEGCLACGGPVSLRLSAAGAASCCLACRWLAHPDVALSENGLQVAYPAVGQA